MLGFERDLWDYATFLTLAILDITSLITTVFVPWATGPDRYRPMQTPKPSILWVESAFSPSSLMWQPPCH